ncbi:MAG TPA: DinB family protein [Bryobacteraceae bacterium]|jgi:uncharacterized damage-inducible protein DinB
MSRYRFLTATYETEILKTLSVWSMFHDMDLPRRPHPSDARGRSVLEHMVHQCMSEDAWFRNMFGIHVTDNPVPPNETRLDFIRAYARDSAARLAALERKDDPWWEETTPFFDALRSRAWTMTRRLTHSAHHRGQQTALLRILGRDLHSTYGPTADTGGLPANRASTIYAYSGLAELLDDGPKTPLPGAGSRSPSERP